MSEGQIFLIDDASGYSQTDLMLSYGGAGSIELPPYFTYYSVGGATVQPTTVEIFDSQGIGHTVSASFVKTDQQSTWDLVLTSMSGDVELVDRRVKGITFMDNGSYGGIGGATPDTASFQVRFGHDPTNVRTIALNFGTIGEFDGLSQFGGNFTAAVSGQDGYASGSLLSLSVTREGVLVGVFTNGIRRDLASLKLAMFQNPAGLHAMGNNYYTTSTNSGDPVPTRAMSGGAGSVRGGALEKSNVDIAAEFVNLLEAQNGFQANARTIRVANDVLRELTGLIR
jgi:flagellar hook protein FlgE